MSIVVALKLVPGRPDVDPLSGAVTVDRRLAGSSAADEAALEWGLRIGERWDEPVVAVTAGPPAADVVLRRALATGVGATARVELEDGAPSARVAAALAGLVASLDGRLVLCGDFSTDRGSGSVPALLAHHLDAQQALGLVELTPHDDRSLGALRRLDGGRRERLAVTLPAVVSLEGATARLRRASLTGELQAERAVIAVHQPTNIEPLPLPAPGTVQPYRPPTRVVPHPHGDRALDRIRELTALTTPRTPPRLLVLEPLEAADAILDQLALWDES